MDKPLPSLPKARIDMLDPTLIESSTLTALPSRPKLRTLTDEPMIASFFVDV
jgi:hypothetical protein